MTNFVDRDALVSFLQPMVSDIVRRAFPQAKADGSGWRIGDAFGSPGRSLKIRSDGGFTDFADPEVKGSVIDLYAMAYSLEHEANLLMAVAKHSGFCADDSSGTSQEKLGPQIEVYKYQGADNSLLFSIARHSIVDDHGNPVVDKSGKPKKAFVPVDQDGRVTRLPEHLRNNRPLFHLDYLEDADDVFIVEGERAAQALTYQGYVAVTWPGGAGCSPSKVDWSPLSGKIVYLWPDNDDVGRSHMDKIAKAISPLVSELKIVNLPEDFPLKGDAVEAIGLGLKLHEIKRRATKYEPPPPQDGARVPIVDKPAPKLRPELFGHAASWLIQYADQFNSPVDDIVAPLLAAISGLIGKMFSVDVDGAGWEAPLCVWTWSIGVPGAKKSPPAAPIMKLLDRVEDRLRELHEELVGRELRAVKDELEACDDVDGIRAGELKADISRLERELKRPPRCKVTDVTREKLASLEEDASRGMVVHFDELAGWLSGMGGYSGQDARSFYLQAFDGRTYQFDRVNEDRTGRIDRHLLSIHGGIQPDVLNSSILKGLDDGLSARALCFWPDRVPTKPVERGSKLNLEALEGAIMKLEDIEISLTGEPYLLPLDEKALELFNDWQTGSQDPRIGDEGKQASAIAKLDNQLLRLAGLLVMLDYAFGDDADLPKVLSADAVSRAVELVESYFVPQIDRVYNDIDLSPEERMAGVILQKLHRMGEVEFEKGDVLRKFRPPGWRAKGAETVRDAALAFLEEAGVVTVHKVPGTKRVIYRLI